MTHPPSFRQAGLVGHPVSHSLSPRLHAHWLNHHGIHGSYEAVNLPPESLEHGVRDLVARGWTGFNVTVPHKRAVMALCDALDDTARRVGAVNTVVVEPDGKLKGLNTDLFGFHENLRRGAPGLDVSRAPAVILGAGGAARAAVESLIHASAPEIRLANRTEDHAHALAESCSAPRRVRVWAWEDRRRALGEAGLLVNTTTLGMTGAPSLDLDLSALAPDAVVNDIVYAPLMTDLLIRAQARGNPTVTGIGMLAHQARPAFAAWFGVMPEVTEEVMAILLSPQAKKS